MKKKQKLKLVLTFDESNIFSPVTLKYGITQNSVIGNALWVIGCALHSIRTSYNEGAIRLLDMEKLHNNLINQIRKQFPSKNITDDGWLENEKK